MGESPWKFESSRPHHPVISIWFKWIISPKGVSFGAVPRALRRGRAHLQSVWSLCLAQIAKLPGQVSGPNKLTALIFWWFSRRIDRAKLSPNYAQVYLESGRLPLAMGSYVFQVANDWMITPPIGRDHNVIRMRKLSLGVFRKFESPQPQVGLCRLPESAAAPPVSFTCQRA